MKQYKKLLQDIKEKGTYKPAAREGMPGTTSLFGYQFRHNLADGFPLLTTKQVPWKGTVMELLWFLNGDTNIKFLDQNNVRYMWHEDAYNYYVKIASANTGADANSIYHDNGDGTLSMFKFEEFCKIIKESDDLESLPTWKNYTLGDCGVQYGELWRNWKGRTISWQEDFVNEETGKTDTITRFEAVDQIQELIKGLKQNPMSRRHILTAWNPATLNDMALNACHAMAQWNCRPLSLDQRWDLYNKLQGEYRNLGEDKSQLNHSDYDAERIPKYNLDCQMYQRSADVFLGVPLNIASYALLTEILCKLTGMIPGEMIYTYGDVHIYDDHKEQVELQCERQETELPKLRIADGFVVEWDNIWDHDFDKIIESIINGGWKNIFDLQGYDPQPAISGKLSTGLK